MELEKSWITELHVRMDCTGCVHKLKRTLHGVEGVYDIRVDFPQQMITVVGRANPEKLVKAIKKTRKIATICSHKENPETDTNSTEATPEVPPPEPEPTAVPEANPPVEEPTQEVPPALEEKPEPPPQQPDEEKELEEIPMVHHYPHHRNLNLWNNDGNLNYDQVVVPYYHASTATHSYSNYYPSPSLSSYAAIVSSPQNYHYTGDYYHNHHQQQQQQQQEHYERGGSDGNNNSISSMFSDENPNACIIV